MKSFLIASLVAIPSLAFAIGSCAQDDTVSGNGGTSGGTNNAGGGNTAGSSSDTGTSGTNVGSSGSQTGSGGTAQMGNAGTNSMGGSGGAGGAGQMGGASGAGGSGPGMLTVDTFAGMKNMFGEAFSNSFMLMPCYGAAGQDCLTNKGGQACPNYPNHPANMPMEEQGYVVHEYFTMGGAAGTNYKVTIKVNGISEGKYYENGTRAAGNADNPMGPDVPEGTDTFYTGGNPIDQENYNVYKITVRKGDGATPDKGTEVAHYYLNSFPKGTATSYENHDTFPIAYSHDITVPGGGVIEYLMEDRNCHAIDNCGPGHHDSDCAVTGGRNIPNEPALTLPATYMNQPLNEFNSRNGASQPFHSQAIHITVTAVAAM